jgi:hypothetical protein
VPWAGSAAPLSVSGYRKTLPRLPFLAPVLLRGNRDLLA